MSFMFPRTVAVHRPVTVPLIHTGSTDTKTVEVTGYSGVSTSTETTIYTGLRASIQVKSGVRQHVNALPSDTRSPYVYSIFVERGQIPDDGIKNRDIVIDDGGERYQVEAVRQDAVLGQHVIAYRLEV